MPLPFCVVPCSATDLVASRLSVATIRRIRPPTLESLGTGTVDVGSASGEPRRRGACGISPVVRAPFLRAGRYHYYYHSSSYYLYNRTINSFIHMFIAVITISILTVNISSIILVPRRAAADTSLPEGERPRDRVRFERKHRQAAPGAL